MLHFCQVSEPPELNLNCLQQLAEGLLNEEEMIIIGYPPWNEQFAPENGWLEDSFPFGARPIFGGEAV